jgi:hypothetical protein
MMGGNTKKAVREEKIFYYNKNKKTFGSKV